MEALSEACAAERESYAQLGANAEVLEFFDRVLYNVGLIEEASGQICTIVEIWTTACGRRPTRSCTRREPLLFGGGAEARVVLSPREKDRPRLRPTGRRPDRGAPAHPVPLSRPRALGGDLRWPGRAGLLGAWDLARVQAHACSRSAGDPRGSC